MENASSPDSGRRYFWALVLLVGVSLAVRLIGYNFDQNHHFHPDERAIADAMGRLSLEPGNLQLNPKWFNYGSFPIYVDKIVASVLSNIPGLRSYDASIWIGRGVSAVAGALTVLLLALLGRRLYGPQVGLLAGGLLGACVLHVQNSHFMTTDVFLTLVVLIALYALIGLVQHGRMRDYVFSGLAIGFAGATKFSALPLLAPLGVAILVRLNRERRFFPILRRSIVALLAVGVAFAVGQPYALLDFATFSRQISEQGRMVRNAGSLPYTNQYVGTPKYAYEIEQIVLWCMGPALGLAAVWATITRTVGTLRDRSGEQLVLLSWVIPYFLVTGWFEVKFPRYLLPIYPIVILWAAAWLWSISRRSRLGRLALWGVVGCTVAYLLAFMSIYQRPHTAVTASEWVYRHVPEGSTLLTQHWDEGFPFHLEGHPRHKIKVVELPYYDGEIRMQSIAKNLADADYLALQTKRLYGAVTMAPDKFRLTNNYFYLLFAGDLGYQLIYDHASRPGLFGFELPDELADESLSVYDHPKVVIFKNVEHLSADEIYRKVTKGIPSKKLTRRDLLLARAEGEGATTTSSDSEPVRSSWLALFTFVALVEILGLCGFALVHRWLPVSGGYALAKVLGVLLYVWVPWLLAGLGIVHFTRGTMLVTLAIFIAVALATRQRWVRGPDRSDWWPAELLFWGTFAFFLTVRAFNPEVFWGEKPMDFSFLNALTRTTNLPPPEPWFSGSTLHYSYFGHYLVAALGKAGHIHPGITFNLGIALIAGMTAAAAFGAGCAISNRWRVGVLAAFFTLLIGNLAGPREAFARRVFNFDYFWATSRVIKDTINEYPLWSFLFADLHAHLLVMPFSLTFIALAIWWAKRDMEVRRIPTVPLLFMIALTLGAIMTTNTWSTFTYVPFFPFLLGCLYLSGVQIGRGRILACSLLVVLLGAVFAGETMFPQALASVANVFGLPLRDFAAYAKGGLVGLLALTLIPWAILSTGIVLGLAALLYYPYWADWSAPARNWGFEGDAFAGVYDFVNIFGLFLFIAIPFLFALWRRQILPPSRDRLGTGRSFALWVIGLVILVALLTSQPEIHRLLAVPGPASVRTGLVLLALLGLHLALRRTMSPTRRFCAVLFSFAFFVTAGVDVIHIWDRMNTVFKFYLESWFLFAVAGAAAVFELRRGLIQSRFLRAVWQGGLVVLVATSVFTAGTATYGVLTTFRVKTPRPTLDGTAYLELRNPHEAAAFEWLNKEIRGIPVIAEAYGPSYQDYARVSMNTGLPTVLGWDYHVHQRAHSNSDINRRKADLKKLYTTDQHAVAAEILRNYHVSLVYVGRLERREYAGGNLARFKEWTDLLTPVYQNEGTTIFAVNGQYTGAMPMTTIEHVPEVHAETEEAEPQSEAGQLRQPRGIAVDGDGNIFVADFGNHRIQEFNSNFEFVAGWGEQGNLPGQFKQPSAVFVGPNDDIYVTDTWNQRIQVFNHDGHYIREWGAAFFGPRGITINDQGQVYIVDTGNHKVRRFGIDGMEQLSWGGLGSEPGQFKEPVGITTDADGQVYVCDNGNARVQIFTANGKLLRTFPVDGWGQKVFSEPHIVVTADGTIWVTVPDARQVRAYDRDGKLLKTIQGTEDRSGPFQKPMGIALMPGGKELVISDLEGRLVKIPLEAGIGGQESADGSRS